MLRMSEHVFAFLLRNLSLAQRVYTVLRFANRWGTHRRRTTCLLRAWSGIALPVRTQVSTIGALIIRMEYILLLLR